MLRPVSLRHCEQRSDEANQTDAGAAPGIASLDGFAALAMSD